MSILIFALGGALMAGAVETVEEKKRKREKEKERKAKAAKYRRAIPRWT